jgi:hypothetical protein
MCFFYNLQNSYEVRIIMRCVDLESVFLQCMFYKKGENILYLFVYEVRSYNKHTHTHTHTHTQNFILFTE